MSNEYLSALSSLGLGFLPALHACCRLCVSSTQVLYSSTVGETPGISIGDIAKTIGEMWRGLSDADKTPYQVPCFDLRFKAGCNLLPFLLGPRCKFLHVALLT